MPSTARVAHSSGSSPRSGGSNTNNKGEEQQEHCCEHEYVNGKTGKCLACGTVFYIPPSSNKQHEQEDVIHENGVQEDESALTREEEEEGDDDLLQLSDASTRLEEDMNIEKEHYERLVLMLDQWKTNMIDRVTTMHKGKMQRVRETFERQQAARRKQLNQLTEEREAALKRQEEESVELTRLQFRFLSSAPVDTEYVLLASSNTSILAHDGRSFKLFDEECVGQASIDPTMSMDDREKVVDMVYSTSLSCYLILYEHGLWLYEPVSSAQCRPVHALKKKNYLAITCSSKDAFLLDNEGTIEQRSLSSWTFLRKYSKHQLLAEHSTDYLIHIRFHSLSNTLAAIVRTAQNRRCLHLYSHFASTTFKFLSRSLFPNSNVFTLWPFLTPHSWLLTTCEKQLFFLDARQPHDLIPPNEFTDATSVDYKVKNVTYLPDTRLLVLRVIKPSQLRLYSF